MLWYSADKSPVLLSVLRSILPTTQYIFARTFGDLVLPANEAKSSARPAFLSTYVKSCVLNLAHT